MTRHRLPIFLFGLLSLIVGGSAQAQTPAGVTAAVNPQATGTPPASLPRVLEIGTNLVQNEHLTTGPEGQAQVLFRDGSTMTLGPGSDLTIDEFVYNPETKTAKLAMTAAIGVFRFVGGRASKDEDVVLITPTATIGIRGAVNVTGVAGNGATDTSLLYGKKTSITSKSTGATASTTKSGYTLAIGGPGQPIVTSKLDIGRLNARLGSFEGHAGASGGARTPPDQDSSAAQTVASSNSSQSPQSIAPGGPLLAGPPLSNVVNSASQFTSQAAQTITSAQDAGLNGRPILPSGSYAFALAIGGPNPNVTADSPLALTSITGTPTNGGNPLTITESNAINLMLDAQGVLQGFSKQSTVSSVSGGSCTGNCSASSTFQATGAFSGVTVQELGGDGLIQFGRFTGGTFVGTGSTSGSLNTTTIPGTVSTHYLYGVPATLLPTSGQFSYQLLGATKPTFTDGSGTPGSFAGSMSVQFGINGNQIFPGFNFTGNASAFVVSLNATVTMPGDGTYTLSTLTPSQQLAAPFAMGTIIGGNLIFGVNGAGLFFGFPNVSATAGAKVCSGATACSAFLQGLLAGPGGVRAGFAYMILPNVSCSGGSCGIPGIQGVAAFRR